MKMISLRDQIESIIEAEFGKTCAPTDEVFWDAGPDTIATVDVDSDGEPFFVSEANWSVEVIVTNPDESAKGHAFISFEVGELLQSEIVRAKIAHVASELAFRRQVHLVDITEAETED